MDKEIIILCDNSKVISCTKPKDVELPKKSKERYDLQYRMFMEWCGLKNIETYTENVVYEYITHLSEKYHYKSSTLWSVYSMLKTSLYKKHNIDIDTYMNVKTFLRNKAVGFVSKQSKIFTHQQIDKFLKEAPDDTYLMMKVILIIGVAGNCKAIEIKKLTIDNIVNKTDSLIINIPDAPKYYKRSFVLFKSEKQTIDVFGICKKYFDLRPTTKMRSRRLFIKYTNGKCVAQNVGGNTIVAVPSKIAAFLKLPHPKDYTGFCFRRTSATFRADATTIIELLKYSQFTHVNFPTIDTGNNTTSKKKIVSRKKKPIIKTEEMDIKEEPIVKEADVPIADSIKQEKDPLDIKVEPCDDNFKIVSVKDLFCDNQVQSENILLPVETVLTSTIKTEDEVVEESEDPLKI